MTDKRFDKDTICGARFPVEIGGWGAFICTLAPHHEGNHIGKIKFAEMRWVNASQPKKMEDSDAQKREG